MSSREPHITGAVVEDDSTHHTATSSWKVAVAVAILALAGWGHRVLVAAIDRSLGQVLQPVQPLSSLPFELGDWRGRDVALDERIHRAANFDDDYINRSYVDPRSRATVSVYVGYVGRARALLGHRPDICYAAHGWSEVSQQKILVRAAEATEVPCVLYEFQQSGGDGSRMLVLATYMTNGRYVSDPAEFRSWNARNPGLLGERPAYLARVQLAALSTPDRAADLAALQDLMSAAATPVRALLPYWTD